MPKLESLNGNTVFNLGDGELEGKKFLLLDNPIERNCSEGWLLNYKGSEIGIMIDIAEKDKDKLMEICGVVSQALKNAE